MIDAMSHGAGPPVRMNPEVVAAARAGSYPDACIASGAFTHEGSSSGGSCRLW
jgi:hypothetical protein